MICLVLKSVVREILVPRTPVKEKVYWIKSLTEKKRKLLRSACINGEIKSSEIWKKNRCAVCMHCKGYRETRTIGAYTHVNGDKEELLNEQTEYCFKYGHERTYNWNKWKTARKEERLGPESWPR